MAEERVLLEAKFNDAVTTYWLVGGMIGCIVSVVGVLFLPVWYFVGKWITRKYLASHRCTLTNRSLKVAKGILTKVEKTAPLDRITDLGIIQGPLMRFFEIEALTIETAGQSKEGALVRLTGIQDGRTFRDAVLKQRDIVVGSDEDRQSRTAAEASGLSSDPTAIQLLTEIRDSLKRIERQN